MRKEARKDRKEHKRLVSIISACPSSLLQDPQQLPTLWYRIPSIAIASYTSNRLKILLLLAFASSLCHTMPRCKTYSRRLAQSHTAFVAPTLHEPCMKPARHEICIYIYICTCSDISVCLFLCYLSISVFMYICIYSDTDEKM